MNRVSIVIVNWNTGGLLARCAASLAALPEYSDIRHIVIVDNASHDDSMQQLTPLNLPEAFVLLPQEDNLGFSKATNLGITYIHEHDGADDHILLLNPDTEVAPHAIANMANVFERIPKAGIVGPKLVEPNGTLQASVRNFPTLTIFILLFLKLHRIFTNTNIWKTYMQQAFDYTQEHEVDQVMGAAFLIRNTLVQEIGTLDESYWIWFEEVDYCKRAHDAGWKTIYTPSAQVVHHGGVSFVQLVGIKKTLPFLQSSITYAKHHVGIFSYLILCALYPIAYCIGGAATIAHMHEQKKRSL